MTFLTDLPWLRQLARRVATLWWLKAVGTSAFMTLFFWGYFSILESPSGPPTVMPLTLIDAWVPFTPLAFPVYVSLWVYVSLPPALLGNLRDLLWFGVWIASLCLLCLGLFWLLPTAVPVADIDWALYPEMSVIKGIDAAGNACPSLHVASAVFAAFWLARVLRNVGAPGWLRVANWGHCLLILWSTLATRQHVALDVLAGAALGSLLALAALHHIGRRRGLADL